MLSIPSNLSSLLLLLSLVGGRAIHSAVGINGKMGPGILTMTLGVNGTIVILLDYRSFIKRKKKWLHVILIKRGRVNDTSFLDYSSPFFVVNYYYYYY